uniref:Uncharacterized protein n=1 Tax=Magallana gigas TaxID=29159 RepID=A0A8W8ILX7_MAGGI
MKYSVCLLVALAGVALAYPTKERRPPPAKNGDDLIKRLEEVLDDIEFDKEYDGFEKRPPPSGGEDGSREGRRRPRPEKDQQEAPAKREDTEQAGRRRPKGPPPSDGEDGSGERRRPPPSDGEDGSGEGRRGPRPEGDQQETPAKREDTEQAGRRRPK